jgi:hypothetical protein
MLLIMLALASALTIEDSEETSDPEAIKMVCLLF